MSSTAAAGEEMDSQKGSVKMVEFVGVGEREKKIKVLNNNSDAKKVHR